MEFISFRKHMAKGKFTSVSLSFEMDLLMSLMKVKSLKMMPSHGTMLACLQAT